MIKRDKYEKQYRSIFQSGIAERGELSETHSRPASLTNSELLIELEDVVQALTLLSSEDFQELYTTSAGRAFNLILAELRERLEADAAPEEYTSKETSKKLEASLSTLWTHNTEKRPQYSNKLLELAIGLTEEDNEQ